VEEGHSPLSLPLLRMEEVAKDRLITHFQSPFTSEAAYKRTHFSENALDFCTRGPDKSLTSVKTIVIGDWGAGKTSFIKRFCKGQFEYKYKTTIGVDFEIEEFRVFNTPFTMQLWDTAGQERFKCLGPAYYRSAHVVVIVFDLSKLGSLVNSKEWFGDVMDTNKIGPQPLVFLVGTKLDCISKATYENLFPSIVKMCQELGTEFWAVSSQTGENVEKAFMRMACLAFEDMIQRFNEKPKQIQSVGNKKLLTPGTKPVKKKCFNCN